MKKLCAVILLLLVSATAFAGSKYSYKFKMVCRGTDAKGKADKVVLYDSGVYCGEIVQENRFIAASRVQLMGDCKSKYTQVKAPEWNDFKFQKTVVSECPK